MDYLISSDLLENEEVLWKGQPRGRLFTWADIYLIPFSILWTGFAIFWEASVITNDLPLIFKLWGIPFVLFGLYFIIGRFFYKAYVNRNTHYYVTNQRVLIIKDILKSKTTALYLSELLIIEKKTNSKGAGKIRFGQSPGIFAAFYENTGFDFYGRRSWYRPVPPTFYYLEDADKVYDLIWDAKARACSKMIENQFSHIN